MSATGKFQQPVSGFSPLNLGGCVLWLDATSTSNFVLSGSNVSTWYDRSGLSNDANSVNGGNPVLSNASINGLPAVYFSNAPSIGGTLTLNNASVTGFMVIRPLQTGMGRGDQRIFSAATSGAGDWNADSRFLIGPQGNTTEIRFNRGNTYIPRTNFNASNNYVISWTYDGLSNYIYLNGADGDIAQGVALSNSAFNTTLYRLANQVAITTETYNGLIGEVIIYTNSLTSAQRQAVEGYLAWKWGIAPALGTTFSPLTSLSNCAVWFDGADSSTFTLSGSNITQWRDKAGSNVTTNIGTPVYTSNAINGVPGVLLDVNAGFKISPMSNAANTTTISVYGLVTSASTAQGNARMFTVGRISDGTTNNDFTASYLWTLFRGGDATFYFQHAGGGVNGGTSALAVGKPCLMSLVFSGTTATLWLNGTNMGSMNTTNTLIFDRIGIGKNINPDAGSQYDAFAGTVGEFLIFYAAHTEAQRLQVESYLASKWNVTMRAPPHLVPTHTYTRQRPFLREFQPTDVSGCIIWLDAADAGSFVLSGSNVTTWRDKSGRGNNFTNAGTVAYTSNAISLTGSSSLTSAAQIECGGTYCTIVTKLTPSASSLHLTGFDNIQPSATMGSYGIRYDTGSNLTIGTSADYSDSYRVNGIDNATTVSPYNTTTPYASRHIVAGSANRSGVTTVRLGAYVGGRNYTGEVNEVLFYSSVPNAGERARIETYLANKWGLRGVMGGPPHPYRYGPPLGVLPASSPAPGCALWLDAADQTTMTLSGSNVTQWRDKSGNGYHASAYQTGPVLSNNGLVFNASGILQGSAPYLHSSSTGEWTTMIVFTASTTSIGNPRILNYPGIAQMVYIEGNRLTSYLFGANYQSTGRTITSNTPYLAAIVNAASTISQYVNGTADVSASHGSLLTTSNTTYYVGGFDTGGSDRFYGTINEILCFSNALSTTQRQQAEGYLAAKWGLSTSLDASHPYKTGPQTTFMPVSIPGCTLWLDAGDSSTITVSGSNVTQWQDKTGSGRAAVSNTTNSPQLPTRISNAVQFAPSQALVVSNLPYRSTWTCVVAMNTVSVGSRWFISPFPDASQVMMGMGSAGDKIFPSKLSGYPADVTGQHVEITTGSPYAWIRDGTQLSSNSLVDTSTSATVRLGIGANGDGGFGQGASQGTYQINELIIFSNAITSAQRQQLEGYLAWKWGSAYRLTGPSSNAAALYKTLTSEFDPRSIGACETWFDAADAQTIGFSSGSNVNRWLDKSGKGYHATAIASSNVAVYTTNGLAGRAVLTFSRATPSIFTCPYGPSSSNQPQTIFLVARPSDATNAPSVLSVGLDSITSLTVDIPAWNSNNWIMGGRYGGLDGTITTLQASSSRTDIVAGTWRSGVSYMAINGTEYAISTETPTSLTSKASGGRTILGSTYYSSGSYNSYSYSGYFAEILIFSKFLTNAERQRIEGYLAWKWGLQSQLPALHPYLSTKF